jgi:isopropylmalate/homocitrate/citramalate synthase
MRDMDFGVTPFEGLPLPTSVTICEVGPRDGLQNESTVLPAGIKAEFVERLVDAGNAVVETTSFVHPERVPQLADAEEVLRKVASVPGARYPVLVPNQRGPDRAIGQALANALTALRRGITTFDSSAGGLGGCPYAGSATGNLATEDLLWQLHGLGIVTGIDLQKMVGTSVWLARQLGRPSPSRTVTALAG